MTLISRLEPLGGRGNGVEGRGEPSVISPDGLTTLLILGGRAGGGGGLGGAGVLLLAPLLLLFRLLPFGLVEVEGDASIPTPGSWPLILTGRLRRAGEGGVGPVRDRL